MFALLFNTPPSAQIENIRRKLKEILEFITSKDADILRKFVRTFNKLKLVIKRLKTHFLNMWVSLFIFRL